MGLIRPVSQPSGQLGPTVIRWAGLVLAALLGQSFFWSADSPLSLKIVVAALAALAAARPDYGLLVLAASAPFGRVISSAVSQSGPVEITEALALSFLAGWCWHRLRRRAQDGPTPPGLMLGYLFATVVAASLLTELGIYRYWRDYWEPFLRQLLAFSARDYLNVDVEFRPWAAGFGGAVSMHSAALLLESLGLMRAAHISCQERPGLARRLLWTLAIAAAGTAVLSVKAASQFASAEGHSLLSVLWAQRIAVHATKVNTAASSFVLLIPVLLGLWARPTRSDRRAFPDWPRRLAAAACAASLLPALWLTGSRTALLAGGTVAASAAVYVVSKHYRAKIGRRSAILLLGACGAVSAVLAVRFYLGTMTLVAASSRGSFPVRVAMWRTTLRTIAQHPVFGTGIGRFPYEVGAFAPDDPDATLFPSYIFHAHNQFLEVAAELGLVGGLLFIGMFGAILWRAWKAFRTSGDPALGGAIAGVVAFLVTCLAGQPLLYDVVAFPFWMVLGVVLAGGDVGAPTTPSEEAAAGRRRRSRLTACFLVVLALSIPVRVWQGQDRVNFALVRYGFSALHDPGYGRPFRLVRDEGTFFTYPHALAIKLPIRRDVAAGRNPLEVRVSLDGRLARTLSLRDDEWQTVEFMIPADARRRYRRIDLAILAPSGAAAQVRVGPAEIAEDQAVEQGRGR